MSLVRFALFILLLAAAGCSRKPSVTFGALQGDEIRATTRIEYRIGNRYGYRIEFPSDAGTVRLREEFTLPSAAALRTQHSDPGIRAFDEQKNYDGSKMTREFELDTGAESAYINAFEITEGDPRGLHTLKLWINGRELRTIEFQIE
jgi:hypothetical protein